MGILTIHVYSALCNVDDHYSNILKRECFICARACLNSSPSFSVITAMEATSMKYCLARSRSGTANAYTVPSLFNKVGGSKITLFFASD